MSCVGIDFGTHSTVVAVVRNKGVDIVPNDASKRLTPSIVVLASDRRYIGESGSLHASSNFRNSIVGIKRLLERRYDDPDIEKEKQFINADLVEDEDGTVCVKLNLGGKEQIFSFVQITSMFFSELNKFTHSYTGLPIKTAVISCPVWYTDVQKRAILDSCHVVGIEPIMVVNDLAAVSLSYGIMKFDLPKESDKKKCSPRLVLLFDMGYSSVQVCVSKFLFSHATVASHASDRTIGGRDIDRAMMLHYADVISDKYKIDIFESSKAVSRLTQACERVKNILSANKVTMLNFECLVGDIDVSIRVTREELEELIEPMFGKIEKVVQNALKQADVRAEDIDFVELVGGTSRIPCIKNIFYDMFGASKISSTLNMDEAVARGCAIQCAMVSPFFKVRDYYLNDWNPYPIELHWDARYSPPSTKLKNANAVTTVAFPIGNVIPSTKMLTIARIFTEGETTARDGTYDFVIGVRYHDDIDKMNAIGIKSKFMNTFVLSGIKKLESKPDRATIKIQLKLGLSGVVIVEGAYQLEDVHKEVPVEPETPAAVPSPKTAADPPDKNSSVNGSNQGSETSVNGGTSASKEKQRHGSDPDRDPDLDNTSSGDNAEDDGTRQAESDEKEKPQPPPKQMKTIKVQVEHELSVSAFGNRKTPAKLQEYMEIESELSARDKSVIETADMRNTLEEYIYSSRSNITGIWKPFITSDEISILTRRLDDAEMWLYGDGSYATKDEYSREYQSIKELGDKVHERYSRHLMEQEKERLRKEEELRKAAEEERKKQEMQEKDEENSSSLNIEVQPDSDITPGEENAPGVAMDVSEPDSDPADMESLP